MKARFRRLVTRCLYVTLLFAYQAAPDVFSPYLDKGRAITLEEAAEVAALVNDYHGVTEAQAFAKK